MVEICRKEVRIESIGIIKTPYTEPSGTPIQPVYGQGVEGRVLVHESYTPALDDIEEFERLWLLYWMDRVGPFQPRVIPYRDNRKHGLFATRSPSRPNPIGMSVVRLVRREGSVLYIADIDILDDTPLLEIKPYVPEFDSYPGSHSGWFHTASIDRQCADNRFHKGCGRL